MKIVQRVFSPLHEPRVTPRELRSLGGGGARPTAAPLRVTEGRAPAKVEVVPISKVRAPVAWAAVSVKAIVTGLLAALNLRREGRDES